MEKETLEKLRRIYDQADSIGREIIEKEFPELKESEDEEMKRKILELVSISGNGNDYEEISAWLEKQKPVEWSEHQHKLLNYAISLTDDAEVKNFLESLRNKVAYAEWSEEDEKIIHTIISELERHQGYSEVEEHPSLSVSFQQYKKEIVWLKSLRPNHWKPSREQMKALQDVIKAFWDKRYDNVYGIAYLAELQKDLERLQKL